jgi:glycerate 2-kinase
VESQTLRSQLRGLYHDVLARVSVEAAMRRYVRCSNDVLHIGTHSYTLENFARILLVSAGKAAVPMCSYFVRLLGHPSMSGQRLQGVVAGPLLSAALPQQILRFPASHPFPTQHSQEAADAVIAMLREAGEDSLVIFLFSGGASAMIDKSMDASFSIEDTAAFHRALVYSGLPITDINVLRKHFSAVKGGRLATYAGAAAQCTVLISDVPGDTPHMIGSGPSLPDPSTREDCLRILRTGGLIRTLPPCVAAYFEDPGLLETPKPGAPEFRKSNWISVLSSEQMLEEAAALAETAGFHVIADNTCDDWPLREAADYLLARLSFYREIYPAVCLLSGGEISVQLTGAVGKGGRNQHFALYCATKLGRQNRGVAVLSAGSDGIDGSGPAAGAMVDWTTRHRAEVLGFDLTDSLERFDSYPLLDALGDTIHTGPTGNNLRDLRVLVSRRS